MKTIVFLAVSVLCLVLLWLVSAPLTAGAPTFPSPDWDGDGLSNQMEENGWYNLYGGPFFTNARDADTDDDGLDDAEEKLFGTDPQDDRDPGIFVKYENDFQTRQYFSASDPAYLSAVQAGDRYLMTQAMVVRRGTTFRLGGPAGATLSISGPGRITYSRDPAGGGWLVAAPSSSTGAVGIYSVKLSEGVWEASMPLYVIFELPADLSDAEVDYYLYDDDPLNLKDETSIWFMTPEPSYSRTCDDYPAPCSSDLYHYALGYAQAFWTDQFQKYVFLDHAMPAIHGYTSQWSAADAVAHWADKEFRANLGAVNYSFRSAMYTWYDGIGIRMRGGACQDNANVFTTIARSAGIAARPFLKDYNKTPGHGQTGQIGTSYYYDHSVLLWLSGQWRGARSWATNEVFDLYYPWAHGIIAHRPLSRYYRNIESDLMISSLPGWDYATEGGFANDTGLLPWEEYGPTTWDYQWTNLEPLSIKQSPYVELLNFETWYGDDWAPIEWQEDPREAYFLPPGVPAYLGDLENWPYDPVPDGCSPSTPSHVCQTFLAGVQAQAIEVSVTPQQSPMPSPAPADETPTTRVIELEEVLTDRGVDLDGNGRFDRLLLQVAVRVRERGTYEFGGWLQVGAWGAPASLKEIYLNSGRHTVWLTVDGLDIGRQEAAGPYTLVELWAGYGGRTSAVSLPNPEPALDHRYLSYETAAYPGDAFEVLGAKIAGGIQHRGIDNDGDGLGEGLEIHVPLNINYSGVYGLEADLYDGAGDFVGHSTWAGDQAVAILRFDAASKPLPFRLDHLMLTGADGQLLDSHHVGAYTVRDLGGPSDQGFLALSLTPDIDRARRTLQGVSPTGGFTAAARDVDGNDLYDELVIRAAVTVTGTGGTYRMEGLLVDEWGRSVAWAVSDPQPLDPGPGSLTLPFAAAQLYDHMPVSGTVSFRLLAARIFSGTLSPETLEEEVAVAVDTPAYSRDDFEGIYPARTLGEEDVESGTTGWTTTSTLWQVVESIWYSPVHAWRARVTGSQQAWLTSEPFDLSDYTQAVMRLQTAHQMAEADTAFVEASTDGLAWTPVATFTQATNHWETSILDLSAFDGATSLQLRFNASGNTDLLWYVDDVQLRGWPAVVAAAFEYGPHPALAGQETLFAGRYETIDASLPVTYTWSFGDGSEMLAMNVPESAHRYHLPGLYKVQLQVQNPYDTALVTETLQVFQPVTLTTVDYAPTSLADDWSVVLTGTFSPAWATRPITYAWEFGDRTPMVVTNTATVVHGYEVSGTFSVQLATSNGYGRVVTDTTEIAMPLDADSDGLPNSSEVGSNPKQPVDSDADGVPDYLDADSDNDGIPDIAEGDSDTDGDGTPNYRDKDSDGDGISDAIEGNGDTDGDGIPNYLDSDSDGDGASDAIEGTTDSDGDGIPDFLDNDDNDGPYGDADGDTILNQDEDIARFEDADGDGIPNKADIDSDDDTILDSTEAGDSDPQTPPYDTDGDGLPDFIDLDADTDNIPDAGEWSTGRNDPLAGCTADDPICLENDVDGDGWFNYVDIDSDGDGALDAFEGLTDLHGDGIPAYLDARTALGPQSTVWLPILLR